MRKTNPEARNWILKSLLLVAVFSSAGFFRKPLHFEEGPGTLDREASSFAATVFHVLIIIPMIFSAAMALITILNKYGNKAVGWLTGIGYLAAIAIHYEAIKEGEWNPTFNPLHSIAGAIRFSDAISACFFLLCSVLVLTSFLGFRLNRSRT
jgi:hypothetical protein